LRFEEATAMARRGRTRVFNSFWHRIAVTYAGRRDGRLGIPANNDPVASEFERQLVQQGQQVLEYLLERHAERVRKLAARHQQAVERAKRLVGQFKFKFHQYNTKLRELGRGVTVHVAPATYAVFMSLIAVGELALNVQAFQVFEKPLPLTFLMALVVAVGLPVSAHYIGVFLKQWPKPAWRTLLYVTLAFGVGIVCIDGINLARSEYLGLLDASLAERDEVLQRAFLYINVFVFVTAILLSYFAHEADQDFANLRRDFYALNRKCHAVNKEIFRLDGELKTAQAVFDAEVRRVRAITRELVYLYRRGNRRVRGSDSVPTVFQQEPALPELPADAGKVDVAPIDDIKRLFEDWSAVDKSNPPEAEAAVTRA
jgi:hypothetical protein